MNIFFTGDCHFNHAKAMIYCNRPFSSVEEMTEIMIQNHNKVVRPTDSVYWLGDFAWKLNADQLERLLYRIQLLEGHIRVLSTHIDNARDEIKTLQTELIAKDSK